MRRAQRIKRNMLIYKLSKEGWSYPEIQGELIRRGFGEFNVKHIGELAREMKKEVEGKK